MIPLTLQAKSQALDIFRQIVEAYLYHSLDPVAIARIQTHLEAMKLDPRKMWITTTIASTDKVTRLVMDYSFEPPNG